MYDASALYPHTVDILFRLIHERPEVVTDFVIHFYNSLDSFGEYLSEFEIALRELEGKTVKKLSSETMNSFINLKSLLFNQLDLREMASLLFLESREILDLRA